VEISIVIPAYNEEKRIESTLVKIIDYCTKNFDNYEIIVVDDGSKDKTIEIISNFDIKLIKNEFNVGKGRSVKRGLFEAKYNFVLFSDADLATPIEELDKMLEYTNDYDIIIASRNLEGSRKEVKQPFYRELMGKSFPFFVNLLVLRGIKDTQCGFKLFRKDCISDIFSLQSLDRWAFDVEVLFIAQKLGYKIKEVPVVWIDKEGSKLNPVKDAYSMFRDLLKIRSNSFSGKYDKKDS